MANNFDSNVTRQLARVFLDKFEASRVLTKAVDTQLLSGRLNPRSGTTVDFKRPTDYVSTRTADGDISSSKNDIITGKATGTVQNYFTVALEWTDIDQALKMDQLDQLIAPAAARIVTDLEVDLANFMLKNLGLSVGDPDTAVNAWSDVADAAAMMKSIGVPEDGNWYYVMNPYVTADLADAQNGLYSGSNDLVDTAWERAMISKNFAGFQAMTSNALKTFTAGTGADRVGAITATAIDDTYATHKDTMIQTIEVDGLQATGTVKAGEIIEFTTKYHRSLATRETIINGGSPVKYRAVVTEDASISSNTVELKIAGPAIFESGGQYNTVSAALAEDDEVTILNTAGTDYQPNLFFHKQAVGMGTVKLPKLYATDTIATTEDGISIRVTRYSDGDTAKQKVRFDLLPAYACFNPFFGGQGHGL